MRTMLGTLLVVSALTPPVTMAVAAGAPAPTSADLVGVWAGTVSHKGQTQPLALELEPGDAGQLRMWLSVPVVRAPRFDLGQAPLEVQGANVHLGAFRLTYDAQGPTLTGTLPDSLAPVYSLPMTLHRVERFDMPPSPAPAGEVVKPEWTFETGSALWAGPIFAGGTVYVGGDDGRLVALDARRGIVRWSFLAGGPIRTRAAVAGSSVLFQADDGVLYKLSTADGSLRWQVRVMDKPVERFPLDSPQSRYDPFGSDVVVSGDRLYLGTYDGRIVALNARDGARVWEYAAGGSILSAPALDAGRLYGGSFDGHVHALDAATGQLVWKRDLRGAITSTPAINGSHLIVGTRSYDLFALDAATGGPVWSHYVWFSWVESSAVIRDGVAYIGSSDAKSVFAFDVRSGKQIWDADVKGWAWGTPVVTQNRVYLGSSMMVGYTAGTQPGAYAIDRASGEVLWRYPTPAPASGTYGFPGSPALGDGLVFLAGLDGRVYAFRQ